MSNTKPITATVKLTAENVTAINVVDQPMWWVNGAWRPYHPDTKIIISTPKPN